MSYRGVLSLGLRRLVLILASAIALQATSISVYAVEVPTKPQQVPATELSEAMIAALQERKTLVQLALMSVHQRASTEDIPISDPAHSINRLISISNFLPFQFEPLSSPPEAPSSHGNALHSGTVVVKSPLWFLVNFNIQLLVEDDSVAVPNELVLTYSLSKQGITITQSTSMRFRAAENAYYFVDSLGLIQALLGAVGEIQNAAPHNQNRPTLDFHRLVGFEDADRFARENYIPEGLPIGYSLRIDKLPVHTDQSWLGRHIE